MSTVTMEPEHQPTADKRRDFRPGLWTKEINVRNFILLNFTPYYGDGAFLAVLCAGDDRSVSDTKILMFRQSHDDSHRGRGVEFHQGIECATPPLAVRGVQGLGKNGDRCVPTSGDSPLQGTGSVFSVLAQHGLDEYGNITLVGFGSFQGQLLSA